jgi:hypothetical protein
MSMVGPCVNMWLRCIRSNHTAGALALATALSAKRSADVDSRCTV